jgi:hypothetical protein
MTNTAHEARVRRLADKVELRAEKSRTRKHFHSNDHGGWMLVANYSNTVRYGCDYELPLP